MRTTEPSISEDDLSLILYSDQIIMVLYSVLKIASLLNKILPVQDES